MTPTLRSLATCALLVLAASACTEQSSRCPQAQGLIDEGIARFSPDDVTCESIPASMALTEPRLIEGGIPADWQTQPTFNMDGETLRATIPIEEDTSLYGTGEIAGALLRNGAVTETWGEQPFRLPPPPGSSALEYDDEFDHLYQAHPWVLAVRANGSSFGVLADTTYRARIDLTDGIEFSAQAPFPVIVIEGASPQDVLTKLADLTGTLELPPLWALGYQQSRWSYTPDARTRVTTTRMAC